VVPVASPGTQSQASEYVTTYIQPIPTINSLVADHTLLQFRCHCTDENHLAGNGFSNDYYVADLEETLKVLKPGFKHWTQVVLSGNDMTNHFCGECGSLVYRTSSGYPGFALKVGNIDVGRIPSKVDTLVWSVGLEHPVSLGQRAWPVLLSIYRLVVQPYQRSYTDIDLHDRTAARSTKSTSPTLRYSLGAGRLGLRLLRVRRRQKWIFRRSFWRGILGNITAKLCNMDCSKGSVLPCKAER
jgi:hypothetical protein